MNPDQAHALIQPFYAALSRPATRDVRAMVEAITAPDWRSFAGPTTSKGRDEFVNQVIGFGRAIPDLDWAIQEVLVAGDRIVVRSEASGTPAGEFMGLPHGGRRFVIMTIDIHTVEGGKLVRADHVEDWTGAIRQLKG